MDKHEYKMCADEIKALIGRKKYNEAMNLADTVDWSRVKNVNMLCTVSDLYKLGKRYNDSRDIMLMAYERHPGDRMIVYSLCELSIKLDDVVQALEYYKEFAQASPNDNRRFILQYRIYEAQEVTLEERIDVLKNFKARERREKWIYELAYLYHRVGLESECIEECDDLFLWFGKGKYVRKGLELKMLHTTLTPQQQAAYDGVKAPKQQPAPTRNTEDLEPVFDNYEVDDQSVDDYGEEMLVPPVNVGLYSTMNLQSALAENVQEVLGSEDQVSDVTRRGFNREQNIINQSDAYNEIPANEEATGSGNTHAYSRDHQEEPRHVNTETDEIRRFESDLGNTTDFKNYEAYENSGVIPPVGAGMTDAQMGAYGGEIQTGRGVGGNPPLNNGEYDLNDIDGEEGIENAPGRKPGLAPGRGEKVGQFTGNIIDQMMLDEKLASSEKSANNINDEYRGDVPTSSIREITLPDEPEEDIEPKVVQMSTGRIPKIVDSVGTSINTEGLNGSVSSGMAVPPAAVPMQMSMPSAESMAREGDENYDRLLSQGSDGQISMALDDIKADEKQITGQISLRDTFLEWEEKKKESRERQDAEMQSRIKRQTGEMFLQFDKSTREDLMQELGTLAENAIHRELGKRKVDIMDSSGSGRRNNPRRSEAPPVSKKPPVDVAALTKGGVPTDTSVLMTRAREVVEGRAPMENAAVSKVIEPFKDAHYDPATEAAQMDAAVNAVVKAAEAATARNMENFKALNSDVEEEVPIYEDTMGTPLRETLFGENEGFKEEDRSDNPESGDGDRTEGELSASDRAESGYDEKGPGDDYYSEDEYERRERRSLTPEEKKLFGPFIQTKGTLNQILDALDNVTLASYTGNIILTGEPDMGTIKLAKNLIKEIQNNDGNFSGRLAKITGDALNRKDIGRTFSQLTNGALIVEGAGAMDEDTIMEMLSVLDREEHGIIVILEDNKINMNKLLNSYEALYDPFNLRIDLEAMDNDSLVNFAKRYAQDREYSIDEMGVLELYTRISDLQTSEHTVTTRDVKQIVDEAIEKADKRNISHLVDIVMGKRYDDEDLVILREKDFRVGR